MLIDLHTHTRRHSWDSELGPDELIDLAKHSGLDGLCLTEHDFFWDPEEVRQLSRRHSFLVLPGVEINTDNGHILCFGLDAYAFGMHRVPVLAAHVQRCNGVMVAAHPYRRQMPFTEDETEYAAKLASARLNPAYPECAAVERINGRGSEIENSFAGRVVDLLGVPAVAGSDAHSAGDIGRCATEFLDPIDDLDGLIAALKAGHCRPLRLASRSPQ